MHRTALRIAAVSLGFVPTIAFAHPGHDGAGLVYGFLHPLGGVDHIIAMVAVGLLAARLGGRALGLAPGSFGAALAGAGLPRMAGPWGPFVGTSRSPAGGAVWAGAGVWVVGGGGGCHRG